MHHYFEIDPLIKSTLEDLIDKPVVITVNEFDEETAEEFRKDFNKANETKQPIIPVIIDSYGGDVYSLLSMISTIKSSEVPVATIVQGKAMSCGAILFSFGTPGLRFIDENATLMIHNISMYSDMEDKINDVESRAAQGRLLNNRLYKMLADNCGQPENYFLDMVEKQKANADWYLSAEEAKFHKIADKVRMPKFRTKIKVETTLE